MSYRTNTTWTEARSRREIVVQLERWNADDWGVVGESDFPVPGKVGSVSATVRFELRGTSITVCCSSQSATGRIYAASPSRLKRCE